MGTSVESASSRAELTTALLDPLPADLGSALQALLERATPLELLVDDRAAQNGALAAALAGQQGGRIESLQPTPAQKAQLGFAAAQGPNPVGADNIAQSAAALVRNAPPAEQAHVAAVVERLGVALHEGTLVANDPLRQVLHTAANAPPGSNAYKGAMAHLTRAAEVLERVRAAPGTALAFDPAPPQNAAQAAAHRQANIAGGATGTEADARVPKLDTELVDADLYYRQDNRGLLQRGLDRLSPAPSLEQQPLTIESVKSTPNTFAAEINRAINNPGAPTQVGRQQSWQQLGDAGAPRQFKVATAGDDGFHQLMKPDAIRELGKMTPDPNARTVTLGERSYSLNELDAIRVARQPEVDARVAQAVGDLVARGQAVTPQRQAGIENNNMRAVHGETPPAALPDGRPVGQANPKLGALPQPPELPGARQGGAIGAAGAFGVSTVAALADGHLTADEAKGIVANTALGGALGAAGAKAEQFVTPAIARTMAARTGGAGAGAALGTTLASRVAGSTVVGAVISAGVSAWQNRDGLVKGDSRAIGNVSVDTAIGAAAVAGGAIAGAAATGALAGSVVPVVGTAVGAVVGLGVGVAITYGAELSGAREWAADKVAQGVDGLKNAASSLWGGLKGVF